MSTQVIPQERQEQQEKFGVAVQEFYNQLSKKYPSLANEQIIPILVAELKLMGLYVEYLSVAAVWGAFYAAASKRLITIPPEPVVLDEATIRKLAAKFPVTITKERQLSQREKNALAGVERVPNNPHKDVAENNAAIDKRYADERDARNNHRLRKEYLELRVKAEMLYGDNPKNHAQTNAVRKAALAELNRDPKFASVRDK